MLEIWLKGLQIVLGLGAFGALVLTGTTLFAGSADRHEPIPAIEAGQPKLSVSLPSYRVIADRNLFKVKEKAAEAPVEPPIAESKLQIQLLGTLVVQGADTGNSDPKGSLAIIRDTSGEVVTLAIGDEFAEKRARLARVEPRRIVLEQSGRLEAVLLDEESAAGAPPAPGMPLPARIGVPGIGVPGQAPAVTPSMAQDVARRMTQAMGPDAAMLAMFRQLQPHLIGSVERDANGRLSGYRIARITEGSPLQGLGLQPGDAIRAINGQALGAEGAETRVFAAFMGGLDARLSVQDPSGRAREVVLPRAVLQALVPR